MRSILADLLRMLRSTPSDLLHIMRGLDPTDLLHMMRGSTTSDLLHMMRGLDSTDLLHNYGERVYNL